LAGNSFKGGKGKNYLRLHKDIVGCFKKFQKSFGRIWMYFNRRQTGKIAVFKDASGFWQAERRAAARR
jgi:hypothetical protein